jgi:hypothetical protein
MCPLKLDLATSEVGDRLLTSTVGSWRSEAGCLFEFVGGRRRSHGGTIVLDASGDSRLCERVLQSRENGTAQGRRWSCGLFSQLRKSVHVIYDVYPRVTRAWLGGRRSTFVPSVLVQRSREGNETASAVSVRESSSTGLSSASRTPTPRRRGLVDPPSRARALCTHGIESRRVRPPSLCTRAR